MLLRTAAASASSLSLFSPTSEPLRSVPARGLVVRAAKGSTNHRALTGVIFEPFEEVKKELDLVPTVPQASLARQKYVDESEAAVNEQIKLLLSLSLSRTSVLFHFLIFLHLIIIIIIFYAVWSITFPTFTMLCLRTLIGTTLRWEVLLSK